MTLEYLQYAIGEIAVKNNLVNWYGSGGSLYEINGLTIKDYPLVYVSATGDHTVYENYTRYTLTIFYCDRLLDDDSNETNIASVAVETLKNLYRQIPMISWVEGIQEDPTIRLFTETERMNDRLAGAYMTVWVDVLNPSVCPVYFDETGYPLGNWIPDGITKNVLDNLASKPWVYQVIADINGIDPSIVEALITKLANYTLTADFATINNGKITEGGNFELATKEDKENLQDQIDGHTDDIHGLDIRVTDLENQTVDWATTGDTEDLQRQIDSLTGQTSELSATTQDLQRQINDIDFSPYATTATTNDLQSQIDVHSQQISSITNNYATTAVTQNLQGQIDTLTGDTHDLDLRVTELENQSVDWATTGDTADLQSQIDALESGITQELNNYTTTAVTQVIEGQITAITANFNNYATTAVTNDLQDQISGLTNSKQDKLTAGPGLNISGTTISENVPVFYLDYGGDGWQAITAYMTDPGGIYKYCLAYWNGYTVAIQCSNPSTGEWYGGGYRRNYMDLAGDVVCCEMHYWAGVGFEVNQFKNSFADYATTAVTDNLQTQVNGKQDALTPGTGITITNNVISATSGIQPAPGSPNQIACIWSGSQAAYEAIGAGNYHSDWLYFIDRT